MNSIGFPNTDIYSDYEHGGEESFWPSFTDIMMVIVMTFLLITVAVILNNWELINNLKASVAAEREATAQVQSALQVVQTKSKENETLEERLTRLEDLLNTRTQHLSQARQQQQQTLQALNSSQQQVTEAQSAIQELEEKQLTSAEQLANLQSMLEIQNKQVATLKEEKEESINAAQLARTSLHSAQQSLEEQTQKLAMLEEEKSKIIASAEQAKSSLISVQQELENTGKELEELKQKDIDGHEKLVSLQGEFDQLDKKYQKLLRPARSTKNKYVVRVVFQKANGGYKYKIGDQDETGLRSVSRNKLEKELSQLREKHGDDLYVKVIIPKGSSVSHSEAWQFTSEMLKKYDYYHSAEE